MKFDRIIPSGPYHNIGQPQQNMQPLLPTSEPSEPSTEAPVVIDDRFNIDEDRDRIWDVFDQNQNSIANIPGKPNWFFKYVGNYQDLKVFYYTKYIFRA